MYLTVSRISPLILISLSISMAKPVLYKNYRNVFNPLNPRGYYVERNYGDCEDCNSKFILRRLSPDANDELLSIANAWDVEQLDNTQQSHGNSWRDLMTNMKWG